MAEDITGPRAARVARALEAAFTPVSLEISDQSSRHAHHVAMVRGPEAGATETHFHITIISGAFAGTSRVARSRKVNDLLKDEFASGLHALSLTLQTPEEAGMTA